MTPESPNAVLVDSLCPKVPPGHMEAKALPGGHHFDCAYADLAKLILSGGDAP